MKTHGLSFVSVLAFDDSYLSFMYEDCECGVDYSKVIGSIWLVCSPSLSKTTSPNMLDYNLISPDY